MDSQWQCACCGELNETFVDPTAGNRQEFVEDCRVCCRPNVITAVYNDYRREFVLSSYQEDVG